MCVIGHAVVISQCQNCLSISSQKVQGKQAPTCKYSHRWLVQLIESWSVEKEAASSTKHHPG